MAVTVKTNFTGEMTLDLESPTLREVLMVLSEQLKMPLCSPDSEEPRGDFKIFVNGVEHERIPLGQNGRLNNGDRVEVTLVILAGG